MYLGEKIMEKMREKQYYKDKIIKMINKIENVGTLEYLHRFLELFLEKWG